MGQIKTHNLSVDVIDNILLPAALHSAQSASSYSLGNFEVFRPAGDKFGMEEWPIPNFTPISATIRV